MISTHVPPTGCSSVAGLCREEYDLTSISVVVRCRGLLSPLPTQPHWPLFNHARDDETERRFAWIDGNIDRNFFRCKNAEQCGRNVDVNPVLFADKSVKGLKSSVGASSIRGLASASCTSHFVRVELEKHKYFASSAHRWIS